MKIGYDQIVAFQNFVKKEAIIHWLYIDFGSGEGGTPKSNQLLGLGYIPSILKIIFSEKG